jgi:MOSC domain-containing protein YiiM
MDAVSPIKIISLQVSLPREVEFKGRTFLTGIFKKPVQGPLFMSTLNLEGDQQADLSVHGGPDKAVYAYSFDAYPWWKKERPKDLFEYGAFGENILIDHLNEDKTYVGDTFEVGGAVLQAAQPRFPCFKLGIKFKDPDVIRMFNESGRPGVYFRVLQEGLIEAGQELKLVARESILLSIGEIFQLSLGSEVDPRKVPDYQKMKSLSDFWKRKLQELADAG